jgi:hypothetical protein
MGLLQQASLVVTPNAYKAGKLYSIIPSNGNGDMTVVRATTDTRINSNKLIESVGLNVPNIDYTNATGPFPLNIDAGVGSDVCIDFINTEKSIEDKSKKHLFLLYILFYIYLPIFYIYPLQNK